MMSYEAPVLFHDMYERIVCVLWKNQCHISLTVFLVPKSKYNFISSSIVKEVSFLGGDIDKFVTISLEPFVQAFPIAFQSNRQV